MNDDTSAEAAPSPGDPPGPPEREWWDDPSLPWRQEPTRVDLACLSLLGVVAVYGLVMLPLRPVMLGLAPHVSGALGYRTGLVLTGALASQGDQWWPLVWVLGAAMSIKFSWIYWWAGRLWGRDIMDVWVAGRSARGRRSYERAWALAHRYETLAIVLTFLPVPLPAGVVYAALGAAGTTLRKFLTVAGLSSLVTAGVYVWLGYRIGEPAVAAVDAYGRYLWYLSIAIIVGMLAAWWWKARREGAASRDADVDA